MKTKNAMITAFLAATTALTAYSQKNDDKNTLKFDCGPSSPVTTQVHQTVDGKEITVTPGVNSMSIYENGKSICHSFDSRTYVPDFSSDPSVNKAVNAYKAEVHYLTGAYCPSIAAPYLQNDKTIVIDPPKKLKKLARKMIKSLSK